MKPLHILVVEDNHADVVLFREALQHHDIEYELHVVGDGQSALQFVAQMETSPETPCPDLMLLDLNLPKIDGPAILQEFRKHPAMRPHAGNRRHVVRRKNGPRQGSGIPHDQILPQAFKP